MIRTYSSEGRRLADYEETSIKHLEGRGRVFVNRDATGAILSAKFLPVEQRALIRLNAGATGLGGVRFTEADPLNERRMPWRVRHKGQGNLSLITDREPRSPRTAAAGLPIP